jgi:hypothetical protein
VAAKANPTPAGVIALLKAHLIARYKLVNVPGRPEELRLPGTNLAVSVQYGCRMVRVRLMEGRKWIGVVDLHVDTPSAVAWSSLRPVLDAWFPMHLVSAAVSPEEVTA